MSEFQAYLRLGFDHITDPNGYDHILFVLALCAIYAFKDWKKVLILITAFTVGHSVTLALATLKLITYRSDIIELLIPITIFITALSNYSQNKAGENQAPRLRYGLAVCFGLIHGMGFLTLYLESPHFGNSGWHGLVVDFGQRISEIETLNLFKVTFALPVGYALVEGGLLVSVKMCVVRHYLSAESFLCKIAVFKQICGFRQRVRHARQVRRRINITFKNGGWLGLVFEPIKARSQQSRKCQIRVAVGPRNTALDAQTRPTAHHPKTCRTIVVAPSQARRSPRAIGVAFVRIDGGRVKNHEFGRVGNAPTQKPPKHRRTQHGPNLLLPRKRILAVLPQTNVNVRT